jgi:hypothetical protein
MKFAMHYMRFVSTNDIYSKKVVKALENLEADTIDANGYGHVSGGFATADIFDYDNDHFDIILKFGVQSDCENTVHTEQLKMDRKTLEIK